MTGTFFAVPGYDTETRYVNPVTERWSDRKESGYTVEFKSMTCKHRQVLADDAMEIGCHTMTHRKLTRVSPTEYHREIVEPKLQLEAELGIPIETFCYPFGRFNRTVLKSVEGAGYIGAAGTFPGYEGAKPRARYRCKRFLIHNPYYFREVLRGRAFSPAAFVRSARVFGRWRFFQ